jgi:hypothetical protein
MCVSVSAGWGGGLRHYPNHAVYISVCRLGGEEDSATIRILSRPQTFSRPENSTLTFPCRLNNPGNTDLSFHFLFWLPVFYFRLWKDLNPRVFPILVSAPGSCRTGDSNSCPPDLELGALSKCLPHTGFRFR